MDEDVEKLIPYAQHELDCESLITESRSVVGGGIDCWYAGLLCTCGLDDLVKKLESGK